MLNDQPSFTNDMPGEPGSDQDFQHPGSSASQNEEPRTNSHMHEGVRTSSNMHEDVRAGTNTHESDHSSEDKHTFSSKMITIPELKDLFDEVGLIRNEVTLRRYCRKGQIKAVQIQAANGSMPWLADLEDAKRYREQLLQTYGEDNKSKSTSAESIEAEKQYEHARTRTEAVGGENSKVWDLVDRLQSHVETLSETHEKQIKRKDELLTDAIKAAAIMGDALRTAVPALKGASDTEIIEKLGTDIVVKNVETTENNSPEQETGV